MDPGIKIQAGDTFPYKRKNKELYSPEKIQERFDALKKRKPVLTEIKSAPYLRYIGDTLEIKYLGKDYGPYILLEQFSKDFLEMNEISDYFIEPVRIRCRRGQRPTSMETWTKKQKTVRTVARKLYGNESIHSLREAVYNFRGSDECGTFRPAIMVDLIRQFKGKRVLDCCAGWGDRLIGAMAAGVSYVGTDPNVSLQPGYDAMIKAFAPKNRRYFIDTCKFEDFEIPKDMKFDMLITSPPYFTYEDYAPKSSKPAWSSVSEYINTFLVPAIRKGTNALVPGGKSFFIINDIPGVNYMAETLLRLSEMADSPKYLGIIVYGERESEAISIRNPQPIFVFENST